MFVKNEQVEELSGVIKAGAFFKLTGVTTIDRFDSQLTIGNVTGIKKIPDFREKRMDTSPEKRVEPVSYTHLDVYKRQVSAWMPTRWGGSAAGM